MEITSSDGTCVRVLFNDLPSKENVKGSSDEILIVVNPNGAKADKLINIDHPFITVEEFNKITKTIENSNIKESVSTLQKQYAPVAL